MPYEINKYNDPLNSISVPDGQIDTTSLSFTLFGRGWDGLGFGYGENMQENLLHVMENFASNTPPLAPTQGQLWFDPSNESLNVYESGGIWRDLNELYIGSILNTHISALAQISLSKLEDGLLSQIMIVGNDLSPAYVSMTGDLNIDQFGITSIQNDAVGTAQIASGIYIDALQIDTTTLNSGVNNVIDSNITTSLTMLATASMIVNPILNIVSPTSNLTIGSNDNSFSYYTTSTTGHSFNARVLSDNSFDIAGSQTSLGVSNLTIQNVGSPSIELRSGDAGQPYIDFSNDTVVDYDVRLQLSDNDNLGLFGGNLQIPEGNISLGLPTKPTPTNLSIQSDVNASMNVFGIDTSFNFGENSTAGASLRYNSTLDRTQFFRTVTGLSTEMFYYDTTNTVSFNTSISSNVVLGNAIVFDLGKSSLAINDTVSDLSLNYGVQSGNQYNFSGNGAAKISLNGDGSNGSINFQTAVAGTQGTLIPFQTMSFTSDGNLIVPVNINSQQIDIASSSTFFNANVLNISSIQPRIELRSTGSSPYIDFSNDTVVDYDVRLSLTSNDRLDILGGGLGISGDLFIGTSTLSETGLTLSSTSSPFIELRGLSGALPYIDFSNSVVGDFDIRLGLVSGDELSLHGGDLSIPDGDLIIGTLSSITSSLVRVLSSDSTTAGLEAHGVTQGTGYLYVGESALQGGGLRYNGDNNPTVVGNTNALTLYRKTGGTDSSLLYANFNSDDIFFNGDIHVQGGNLYINNQNTQISEGAGDSMRVSTPSGFIDIGAQNASFAHIYTDRPSIAFDKPITPFGGIVMNNTSIIQAQRIDGQFGNIARSTDEWLRLNDGLTHTNGIFCGTSILRTDGSIQIGSNGSTFNVTNIGNISSVGSLTIGDSITMSDSGGSISSFGDMFIGSSGNGNSNLYFHDDNSNAFRGLRWNDSSNIWEVEDSTGIYRTLWHSGNDGFASTLDAGLLAGRTFSLINLANSVVGRDGAGDISTRLFRSEFSSQSTTPNFVMIQHTLGTGDNYLRPISITSFANNLPTVPNATTSNLALNSNLLDGMLATTEPDPNTIVERNSSGRVIGTNFFTASSTLNTNPGFILSQNSIGAFNDSSARPLSISNLAGIIPTVNNATNAVNATLATNSTQLDNMLPDVGDTSNTIVARDSSGNILANILRTSTTESNSTPSSFIGQSSTSATFLRKYNATNYRNGLSVYSRAEVDAKFPNNFQNFTFTPSSPGSTTTDTTLASITFNIPANTLVQLSSVIHYRDNFADNAVYRLYWIRSAGSIIQAGPFDRIDGGGTIRGHSSRSTPLIVSGWLSAAIGGSVTLELRGRAHNPSLIGHSSTAQVVIFNS